MDFSNNSCYRVTSFDTCLSGQTMIGNKCYTNCLSGYVMNPNTGICVQQCPTGYTLNFTDNSCYQTTPFDTCSVGQTKIGTSCYDNCISGYIMNPYTGACVQTCPTDYTMNYIDNICYKTTPFDNCLPGQTKIGNKCFDACLSGYIMNPNTGECVRSCPDGYSMDFNNNICNKPTPYDTCLSGQTKIGTKCFDACLSGYIMNPNTGDCIQSCPVGYNMNFDDNICYQTVPYDTCLPDQIKIGSKCFNTCLSGYIMNPNTGVCVQACASGYTMNFNDNTCYKVTPYDTCLPEQTKIGSKCFDACLSGYIMNPNTGACIQACTPGYTMNFNDNTCYKTTPFDNCSNNQVLINNKCFNLCASGYTMNPNTGACVQNCMPGQVLDFTNNTCYKVTPFDTCLSGQIKINNNCFNSCAKGYIMNPNTGVCVQACPSGYNMNFNDNTCYKVTPFDSCSSNQTKINNKCYNNCSTGYVMNPNTGACVQNCPSGYNINFNDNKCYKMA